MEIDLKNKIRNFLNRVSKKMNHPEIENDAFIRRLPSSVIGESMMAQGQQKLIETALLQMPSNGQVLEIGSFGGYSANLIIYLLNKHKIRADLYCTDPWIYEGYEDKTKGPSSTIDGRIDVSRIDYSNYVFNAFKQSCLLLSKNSLPFAFRASSDDFFSKLKKSEIVLDVFGREVALNATFSFVYIDGDHSYHQCKKDFENALLYSVPGALILLDNSNDGLSIGSSRFALELVENNQVDIISKYPNYLLRKKY